MEINLLKDYSAFSCKTVEIETLVDEFDVMRIDEFELLYNANYKRLDNLSRWLA